MTTSILNLRKVHDDALDLADRVVLSFLWKWAWVNRARLHDGKKPIRVTVMRLRRVTGYRSATVAASVAKLRELGYLMDEWQPDEKHPNVRGFWKIELSAFTDWKQERNRFLFGIDREIFMAVANHEDVRGRSHRANWWRKALGIGRRTAFRWQQWLYTDDGGEAVEAAEVAVRSEGFRRCW